MYVRTCQAILFIFQSFDELCSIKFLDQKFLKSFFTNYIHKKTLTTFCNFFFCTDWPLKCIRIFLYFLICLFVLLVRTRPMWLECTTGICGVTCLRRESINSVFWVCSWTQRFIKRLRMRDNVCVWFTLQERTVQIKYSGFMLPIKCHSSWRVKPRNIFEPCGCPTIKRVWFITWIES
jgi:hypothetical protein